MQGELDAAGSEVQILGVNGAGLESGNDAICEGRTLPWLQDTDQEAVWETWGVAYRDVVILDAGGVVSGVVNLTVSDLAEPDNYEALKATLGDL